MLDPPFREIDISEEAAVSTVAYLLRAAWRGTPPPNLAASAVDRDASSAATSVQANAEEVWTYMKEYSRMSDNEKITLTESDTKDLYSPWRLAVYYIWRRVFADTADFLWDVSGTTIGHWHAEFAEKYPNEALGQVVLYHGQKGADAVQQRFQNNVLLTPTFLDADVKVRGVRLPMDGTRDGYFLEDRCELPTWYKDSGDMIWFLRRDVPIEFHVEPAPQNTHVVVERTGVAAVFVYANLCVEIHSETRS